MSMPELTDDQLDGLFRKSVEEFDTPFDPAAWQDMKARLDANDRTTPSGATTWKNLLRWGLPVALLLLLTGGSWFIYHNVNSTTKTPASQKIASPRTELTSDTKGIQPAETPRLADTEQLPTKPVGSGEPTVNEAGQLADRGETVNESDSPKRRVDQPAISLSEKVLPGASEVTKSLDIDASPAKVLTKPRVSGATKSVISSYRLTTAGSRANRSRFAKESGTIDRIERPTNRLSGPFALSKGKGHLSGRKQRKGSRTTSPFSGTGYALPATPSFTERSKVNGQEVLTSAASSAENNVIAPESNEAISVVLPVITELAGRPTRWPKSLAFKGRPVEAEPDTTVQRVTPKLPPMRGLSVRFVVSPDLSSVGLKNFSRPGTNIGLLLEYRLASRWSIQAGVIKSTKVYKALPSEYDAPTTWWQPPMKSPDLVDGRCNMFDIPINIRYDVVIKPRSDGRLPDRWFVSSGVTSYIMKQEEYYYTYPAHTYNQPTEYSPSGGNTGGYRFSNLNLSFGFERSFSRRLSWQVEPFMKAPLKGVGFFKVNLLSTGAFFSLRYKL